MLKALAAREGSLARLAAERARLRFVNGIDWLIRDPDNVVGTTPHDVIYQRDKLTVRRYRHPGRRRWRTHGWPVLLVPPLMVKPFIFDLRPERSLVMHLLEAGFGVYLVDFGEPDRADAYVTLDHYVVDWIPAACAAVRDDSDSDKLSLVGYCMGGLFSLSHTAANHDESVANIVGIAVPVDTHEMGILAWLAKHGGAQIDTVAKHMGNVPGRVSSTAFRMLAPMRSLTRYADLFMNMWNDEYVNGFDAMNQWTSQFIDYPQQAFRQFFSEFMRKNKLARGEMTFRGKRADLKDIRAPLLVFAGETDQVATPAAVEAALEVVGSEDKAFELAPGGHMGVFAGSKAPQRVWAPATDWLAARTPARAARSAGRRTTSPRSRAAAKKAKRSRAS